ncbi:hypothetical protein H2199_000226 [Coniosporium tulheliwenetii]|uniref:Uncharacterized protein n=1 Tax=Coniosporium tulheliwenetii TaxID=3383036 RepID=A0ACC2ZPD6_9PEZI|nr:hypothetical protein H2199_000226 [Cladosporium sp. JES 115]
MASFPNLDFGSGLVEIAALTALIGSTTAESLVLGTRGAAGMPWAALSSFGSVFLIKACIAASTPGWLRDTMGVRNARSDAAIGLSLDLNRRHKGRKTLGEAIGVSVLSREGSSQGDAQYEIETLEDVHAFDDYTSAPLRACVTLEPNSPLQAYTYVRDPHWATKHMSQTWTDCLSIAASSIKLTEIYVLWRYGAHRLCWITAVNWIYFVLAAVIIQIVGVAREYNVESRHIRCLDILAGNLPTPQIPGEERKVLLGVPMNARKSLAWRLTWALGSIVCATSLIATYTVLSKEPQNCLHIWLAFQAGWLVLRSVFYHFAVETDDVKHSVVPIVSDKGASQHHVARLLALAAALSKYQTLAHPRGPYCYSEDTQAPADILELFRDASRELQQNYLPSTVIDNSQGVTIDIVAVIGDTVLSSIAWLQGHPLTGMDLYDSCIVALSCSGRTLLVPSARVLSGPPKDAAPKDIETSVAPNFAPRGGSNDGVNISWVYWIPCTENRWLYFRTHKTNVRGVRKATLLTGQQVTAKLAVGDLYVSLTSVVDVEDIVLKSRTAAKILRNMLASGRFRVRSSPIELLASLTRISSASAYLWYTGDPLDSSPWKTCKGQGGAATVDATPPATVFAPRRYQSGTAQPVNYDRVVEEETLPGYDPAEFYPVHIGQILHQKYQVLGKLGFGANSTVWLCRDFRGHRYVALKVYTLTPTSPPQVNREVHAYQHLSTIRSSHAGQRFVRDVLDSFDLVHADGGHHHCLVHPPLHITIRDLQRLGRKSTGLPEDVLKGLLQHILPALDFFHTEANVIHCDIKASNLMLTIRDEGVLADFEKAERENPCPRKVVNSERTIYTSRDFRRPKDLNWGHPVLCDFG